MTKAKPRPRRTGATWSWQQDAACRGESLVLFFGGEGERSRERDAREADAKAVCATCSARLACLDYALNKPENHGLYGGLTEKERASERRRRMRRAARGVTPAVVA